MTPPFDDWAGYAAAKPGAATGRPWQDATLGFKVGGKLFAAIDEDITPPRLNLKSAADRAAELVAAYPAVSPHRIHPRGWVSVSLDGSLTPALIAELIDASYDLVVRGLTKRDRAGLGLGD